MPNRTTPVDGQPWPFADFIRDSPLWSPSGVVGVPQAAYGDGDLGLSFDIVSGTSVTPKLALGRGRARGGRYERTVSPWTSGMSGTVPQDGSAGYPLNTSSNPRRDRIVLRRDIGLQAVYPLILPGTPAATPAAAALTPSETGIWDIPLHSWTLPGGSSTAPTAVLDERRWISPDGRGIQPITRRSARRPGGGNGNNILAGASQDYGSATAGEVVVPAAGEDRHLDISVTVDAYANNAAATAGTIQLFVGSTAVGDPGTYQNKITNTTTGARPMPATARWKGRVPAGEQHVWFRVTGDGASQAFWVFSVDLTVIES